MKTLLGFFDSPNEGELDGSFDASNDGITVTLYLPQSGKAVLSCICTHHTFRLNLYHSQFDVVEDSGIYPMP